jgi:cytochrome P450
MTDTIPREARVEASGPRGLPLAGNVFRAWSDPLSLMLEASKDFGPVALLRFGWLRYYVAADVDAIHRILQTNAKNYVKSRNYAGVKYILGQGLLTSEGEKWLRQRRMIQPAFHHTRLPAFAETMASYAASHVAGWSGVGDGPVDVHAEMMSLTLRIVGKTLFNVDLAGDARSVGEALDVAIHWAQAYAEQIVRLPPWVPTPGNLRFKRALGTLDELVRRIIGERRATGVDEGDLLGMLMAARDEDNGTGMNDTQLADEVKTLVLAGHETTANALAFALHLLALHPEEQRRVQREADAVLGTKDVRFEDLPRLEAAERVVQESMRLYPPAWCFERDAIDDDTLSGTFVPKGSVVAVCPYALHRSEAYWERPDAFEPDRFRPERVAARPKQAYLPFGDGPRVCIGRAFAMMEAKIILVTIAQRYRVEPAKGSEVDLEPGITLRPRGGLRVHLRPRRPSDEVCDATTHEPAAPAVSLLSA